MLGLALLIAELKRPRVSRLAVADEVDAPDDVAFTRRGVAASIRAAVAEVDGIRSAAVRVRHRTVRVRAVSAAEDVDAARTLQQPATTAAEDRLRTLQLASSPRLSVRVAPRSR